MNYYKGIVLLIFFTSLLGCAAAGVVYTSDPYKKIDNAYSLMRQGRAIPAERLGKEALADFTKSSDKFGIAEAHLFFGQFYKHKTYRAYASYYKDGNEYDPTNGKAIFHSAKAVETFINLGNYTQAAKAEFSLANSYIKSDKNKACQLYDKSLVSYEKGKKLNPGESFWFDPRFNSFEDLVNAYKKGKNCV